MNIPVTKEGIWRFSIRIPGADYKSRLYETVSSLNFLQDPVRRRRISNPAKKGIGNMKNYQLWIYHSNLESILVPCI
jgi:hypothetical protein